MVDNTDIEHSTFIRPQGQLEQAKKIDQLPPTPITPDAQQRLESWGIPTEFIPKLQIMASSFRYDLCPEKAERFVRQGGFLYQNADGSEDVVLPGFYDYKTRQDGQCNDISIQFLNMLRFSGYIDTVNRHVASVGKPPISPYYINGQSREYFNRKEMRHVWIGLLQEGTAEQKMITLDASLQEISTMDTNGYNPKDSIKNPDRVKNQQLSLSFPVGRYSEYEGEPILRCKLAPILGMSFDRKFAYSLGFVKHASSGLIRPIMGILRAQNTAETTVFFNNNDTIQWANEESDITDAHKGEINRILYTMRSLPLSVDQHEAKQAREATMTIEYRQV